MYLFNFIYFSIKSLLVEQQPAYFKEFSKGIINSGTISVNIGGDLVVTPSH